MTVLTSTAAPEPNQDWPATLPVWAVLSLDRWNPFASDWRTKFVSAEVRGGSARIVLSDGRAVYAHRSTLDRLGDALSDSAAGRTVDLGDFTQYADDEIED